MDSYRSIFNRISYLQYPLMLLGLFFAYRPIFTDMSVFFVELNKALVFLGLGISFSTLQDTRKVQNNFSKRIYKNPKYTRIFIIIMVSQVIVYCSLGLIAFFMHKKSAFSELAFGLISIGIGMIGLLKTAVEMAEYQQGEIKRLQASEPSPSTNP